MSLSDWFIQCDSCDLPFGFHSVPLERAIGRMRKWQINEKGKCRCPKCRKEKVSEAYGPWRNVRPSDIPKVEVT